ncbi:hypothetical protein GCM10022253_29190 [Sphingomonas endophytica]|jgi:ABC-type oligopeptide transport system substrate-binding subunit|uniref:ABC-type oligopeptide transport system substrate-binding subunit n=1 Tax=Sphingomonas endophytica TaxID=869719 RepID=A0A7X0MNS9_9SPHN|nr:hypothetical protein [Sphingomonas endophytica]MBB5727223.1 ABC-type oligopeptide transport system substrate-binding subunit [Sphingomonas endophytica]MBB6503793.1 ABC-type oligopeptide transport system substrate-binding subunit [Sphingomonas endophytica]
MKKIVAGMSAVALALSLAACGSKTDTANDTALNAEIGNDVALNETLPADENLSDVGALPLNATDGNVAGATTTNAL